MFEPEALAITMTIPSNNTKHLSRSARSWKRWQVVFFRDLFHYLNERNILVKVWYSFMRHFGALRKGRIAFLESEMYFTYSDISKQESE